MWSVLDYKTHTENVALNYSIHKKMTKMSLYLIQAQLKCIEFHKVCTNIHTNEAL